MSVDHDQSDAPAASSRGEPGVEEAAQLAGDVEPRIEDEEERRQVEYRFNRINEVLSALHVERTQRGTRRGNLSDLNRSI
jgi:hypothetical protein